MTEHERNLYNKRIEAQEAYIVELQGVIQGWLAFQGDLAEVLHGNRITWKGGAAEITMVKSALLRSVSLEEDIEICGDMIDTYAKTVEMLVQEKEERTSPEEDHAELKKAFQRVADEEASLE